MGKLIQMLMVCLAGALWVCGAAADEKFYKPPEPEYYIARVGQPIKIELLGYKRFGNLEPWIIAKGFDFDKKCMAECRAEGPACWKLCAREPEDPGTDDVARSDHADEHDVIVVSNACGFMRTTYWNLRLARATDAALEFSEKSNFVVYTVVGEWCGIKRLVHDEGAWLIVRKWGKSYYEIHDFQPKEVSSGFYVISPFDFRERARAKIKDLFVVLKAKQERCYTSSNLGQEEIAEMSGSEFAHRNAQGALCITHGLPISKIVTAYKRLGYI